MDFEQFMSSGAFEKALQQEEGEAAEGIDDEVFLSTCSIVRQIPRFM